MKARFILPVVVVAAIAGAFWLYSQRPETKASLAPDVKAQGDPAALSPSAVLSIKVGKASALPVSPGKASAIPTLAHEFDMARALKPLYDRLTGPGAPSTPEARFILYKILATCATRTDRKSDDPSRASPAERRKVLADNILDSNPDKAKRLAAFDSLAKRCEGFDNVTTSSAELDRMREAAARAGDPAAQASQVAHDIFDLHMTPGTPAGTVPITEAQMANLRQVLASRDPDAILAAGTILSNTFPNVVLEVGPNHDEIDGRASMAAWRLVACEYGLDCGPDSREVMSACAYSGQCGAGNIPDLVFYYQVTPNQAQLIDQYRQAFRSAIESGDPGQFQAEWRAHRPNMTYGFTTSP